MPGNADAWWDDLRQEAELPPVPRPSRWPVILGAVAAVVVSAGLGWWLSSPGQASFQNPAVLQTRPAPATLRLASDSADQEQVRRAYEEFGLVYANSGPEGLRRFSESCQQSLRGDPRILDFCLAFDLFAESVADQPAGKAQANRLALVQSALPAQEDPGRRIQEVRRLMRVVTGLPAASPVQKAIQSAPPAPDLGLQNAAATARAAAASPPVRLAKAAPVRRAPAAKANDNCRFEPTPADRLLCATPALRRREGELKAAYERALAAGADPLVIDRGQAEWRAARNDAETPAQLADFYARRIRELDAAAEAAPNIPPS